MVRTSAVALFALVLFVNDLRADELKGLLKNIDLEKGTITLMFPVQPGGMPKADQTFTINKETKIVNKAGKDLEGGLKAKFFEKAGGGVTITMEQKGKEFVVTKVQTAVDAPK